jgi:hypothetical protein
MEVRAGGSIYVEIDFRGSLLYYYFIILSFLIGFLSRDSSLVKRYHLAFATVNVGKDPTPSTIICSPSITRFGIVILTQPSPDA